MHARSHGQVDGTEELLTVEEAGRRLALGRSATYRLVMLGELRSVKLGRSRRVVADSVREYARQLDGRA